MTILKVLAGPRAFSHIRAHGLNQVDVQSVVCASGAAKTLTTIGLDKVILGQWLKNIDHSVDLLGTSAGAFKLAAACRNDTQGWLDQFAKNYCNAPVCPWLPHLPIQAAGLAQQMSPILIARL